MTDSEKAEVYRRWRGGEVSDEEAKEFFGSDFELVQQLAKNDAIVERTPDPDDDGIDTPDMEEFLTENQDADDL